MIMTNAQILSAVINKWGQPFIQYFINSYLGNSSIVQMIQNKVVSMGFVPPNWSLFKELSPLMEGVSGGIVIPILQSYLSKLEDSSIPPMVHQIVDSAIKNGKLVLLGGKIEIEEEDLRELKRLLELNLPLTELETYEVITDDK